MKITMTSVFVEDPVKAHKFYTETLGFISKEFIPEAQICIVVSPEDPDGVTLLLEPFGYDFAKTYQQELYKVGLPCIVFGGFTPASDNAVGARSTKAVSRSETPACT